jgi:hypothetical protein
VQDRTAEWQNAGFYRDSNLCPERILGSVVVAAFGFARPRGAQKPPKPYVAESAEAVCRAEGEGGERDAARRARYRYLRWIWTSG